MAKLWASIKKDWRILIRDRVGLALMFIMPIVLAIVIASVQNSTFELVNNKKIPLLIANKDTGAASKELEAALEKGGMFVIKKIPAGDDALVKTGIEKKEALVGLVIPNNYTHEVMLKAENVSEQALQGVLATSTGIDTSAKENTATPLTLYYHPVLQNSFRQGIDEALSSVLQIVQSKYIVRQLYSGINDDATIPVNLEQQILTNQTPVRQLPVSKGSTAVVLNATQHNIPAWTVFAMFFIVISLGSSIVREKTSGSFLRLKTMPTSLAVSFVAKQITYVLITILQAIVIFGIGKWLFPKMGLPALNFPEDKLGLLFVILICGWCAASFAMCIGILSKTQEQSNGVGAISIVLFAAIGGLLVPSFAMPESFQSIMKFSPLHWCLEAFYGLFLEGGRLKDVYFRVIPILGIIVVFQMIAWVSMRRQRLI
ncbi:MAG TPA: ABC transporter permease [Niabella sp.]|nr:ABC transporter permease [Chitinophagaceae bacterium]HRO84599.1 ABC transporter permease [Niabella sp.]